MTLTEKPVAYDGARAVLVALTKVCRAHPKSGRKARRRAIRELEAMPMLPDIRNEAIRGLRRSCGACKACKGV